jgi:BlaI family transcriptional regulator, penicillinase repressor
MHVTLADREAEIMDVLWEQGPSTAAEVRECVSDRLAYTTVLTMLRKLEAKGYVGHTEEGRAHRYRALIARDAARQSALRSLSAKLFKGSYALLVTHLISDKEISDVEVRRIRSLLNERAKRTKA